MDTAWLHTLIGIGVSTRATEKEKKRKGKREWEREIERLRKSLRMPHKKLHMGMDSYTVFAQKTHLSLRYAGIQLNSPFTKLLFQLI